MSKNFQPLSSGEVLSVNSDSQFVIGHSTFRVSEFTTALKQIMLDNSIGGITQEKLDWLTSEGIECDVLRFGSTGWVKGKVRLHLEFAEDEDGEVSPDPKSEAVTDSLVSVAAIATPALLSSPNSDLGLGFDGLDEELPEVSASPMTESPETDLELDFGAELAGASGLSDEADSPDMSVELEAPFGFGGTDLGSDEVDDDDEAPISPDPEDFALDNDDFNFEEEVETPPLGLDSEDSFGFDELEAGNDITAASLELQSSDPLSKDTLVQEDDDSFSDLFGTEELIEEKTSEELDGLFEDEDAESVGMAEDAISDLLDDPFVEDAASPIDLTPTDDMDDALGGLFDDDDLFDAGEGDEDLLAEDHQVSAASSMDEFDDFDLGIEDDFNLQELGEENKSVAGEELLEGVDDDFLGELEEETEIFSDAENDEFGFDEALAADSELTRDFDAKFAPDEVFETDSSVDSLFEEKAESTLDDDFDLEAELPPEIDFGSTEDLGEFIDVSIMKRKTASQIHPPVVSEAPIADSLDDFDDISGLDLDDFNADEESGMAESNFYLASTEDSFDDLGADLDVGFESGGLDSPFDLGDDDFDDFGLDLDTPSASAATDSPFDLGDNEFSDINTDSVFIQDDDIGLGELLDDGEDDFDFDALGADPLDAITGEEDIVSADIWALE